MWIWGETKVAHKEKYIIVFDNVLGSLKPWKRGELVGVINFLKIAGDIKHNSGGLC